VLVDGTADEARRCERRRRRAVSPQASTEISAPKTERDAYRCP
jgi:hypothetical protein